MNAVFPEFPMPHVCCETSSQYYLEKPKMETRIKRAENRLVNRLEPKPKIQPVRLTGKNRLIATGYRIG